MRPKHIVRKCNTTKHFSRLSADGEKRDIAFSDTGAWSLGIISTFFGLLFGQRFYSVPNELKYSWTIIWESLSRNSTNFIESHFHNSLSIVSLKPWMNLMNFQPTQSNSVPLHVKCNNSLFCNWHINFGCQMSLAPINILSCRRVRAVNNIVII